MSSVEVFSFLDDIAMFFGSIKVVLFGHFFFVTCVKCLSNLSTALLKQRNPVPRVSWCIRSFADIANFFQIWSTLTGYVDFI